MRYIDIDTLRIRQEWQDAANVALEEVRAASPAQRSAVINKHQELWKKLKDDLKALSYQKCWYCESVDIRSDNAVDHFRPKGNVKDANPPHDGYWWLAFDWHNYRFSCTFCNSIRSSSGTSGGKADYFPLWDEAVRARRENDPIDDEIPLLIDPANPLDVLLIAFADDGTIGPSAKDKQTVEYQKADQSIKRYHLDHENLNNFRAAIISQVRRWVDEADKRLARQAKEESGDIRNSIEMRMKDILRSVSPKSPYSMAVKHLLAGLSTRSDAARAVLQTL